MWAIMKTLKKLPHELVNLNQEETDFILLSMERDAKEAESISKGYELSSDFVDSNWDKIAKADEDDWEVLEKGHNADDIYNQVVELTKQVNPEFEKANNQKLQVEQDKVKYKLMNKKEIVNKQKEYVEQVKQRAKKLEKEGRVAPRKPNSPIDYSDTDFKDI